MSLRFDPKSKADSISQPLDVLEEAFRLEDQNQSETAADPYAIQSEMNLLFSGANRARELKEANPVKEPSIPDLMEDILGPAPQIGNRSELFSTVIDRYILLRQNLIERRNSLSHALEGYLQPTEAFDIYDRIETIDRSLVEVERNIQRAQIQKEKIERAESLQEQAEIAKRNSRANGA